ncbi:MAG TPA: TraB/GumN family protein, partial [Magnetospirillaceae bacterium]|nr:TraB/GumN family protein [Magnetospirillaceae bacterium]
GIPANRESSMQNVRRLDLAGRTFVLVGTAHVSRRSMDEASLIIEAEKPERVCVELDGGRYRSMTSASAWESLDIGKVLKEGKGFLLLANLALASFQRRLGGDLGVKPGQEMLAAVETAEKLGIPWSLCDREVQTTLRRAWGRSGFWGKSKLLASLLSGVFVNEKLSALEVERLKERDELDGLMRELADYMPSVKQVLIDERDRYLAARIYSQPENSIVAVVGAGHLEGLEAWLRKYSAGEAGTDVSDLETVPQPSRLSRILGWILPLALVGLIGAGFFRSGAEVSLRMLVQWVLWNGSLAALGSALCMAHPLTVLASFLSAPAATLNPLVGVGMFAGVVEAFLRKPSVRDFETLSEDISTFRGFYRNRVTHILLVFFLSSIGGALGNFISIPLLAGVL